MALYLVSLQGNAEVLRIEATEQGARIEGIAARMPAPEGRGAVALPMGGWTLAADRYQVYRFDANGRLDAACGHPAFADLHGVVSLPGRRFATCSSQADAVFVADFEGHLLWEWWATEHGYTAPGERFCRNADYRGMGCQSAEGHVLHPNDLQAFEGGLLVTCLGPFVDYKFEQGCILWLPWEGGHQVLRSGLAAPHCARAESPSGPLLYVESDLGKLVDGDWSHQDPRLGWPNAVVRCGGLRIVAPDRPALIALDDAGEIRWELTLPGEAFSIEPIP